MHMISFAVAIWIGLNVALLAMRLWVTRDRRTSPNAMAIPRLAYQQRQLLTYR